MPEVMYSCIMLTKQAKLGMFIDLNVDIFIANACTDQSTNKSADASVVA